jgi:hypothetical protein
MSSTSPLGPLSHLTPVGKTTWIGANRLYRTATLTSAAAAVNTTYATTWFNCFDSNQIPIGSTIDGIELVSTTINGGDGKVGTAGSTGAAESGTLEIYFYNGTSYSSAVFSQTFTGPNDYEPSPSGGGQIIAGGPSNLVGLTWDPLNQANFGFRIDVTNIVATPVLVAIRGLALKVYYSTVSGPTNIPSVDSVPANNISNVNNVPYSSIISINGVV